MKKSTSLTKTLLLAGCLLSFICSKAQSVSYKIAENDPDNRTVFLHLNPFNCQAYLADITIGYDLQATWLAAKHLQLEVDYRKAYLDENATGVFSPKGLKKSTQLQLGGVLNFMNRLKTVNNKVILQSHSSGGYNYSKYIHVRAEARKIAGFRGGLQTFFSNHKVSNGGDKGNPLTGKTENGDLTRVKDTITFETINYTARSLGLYAGIDFKSIRNVVLETDNFGTKSNKVEGNFYADVLFTPLVKYELKPNGNQPGYKTVDVNISENKKRLLGWRVGYQYIFNYKVGFNAKFEIGQQPGVVNQAFFCSLGFGMTVGFKVKQLPI